MTKKEIELIEKDIENNLKAGECGLASNNEKFQWTNTANAMKKMLEENKKLKDNWDELKKYLHNVDVAIDYSENYDGHFINYDELIDKMQELEKGSGSDVKD